MQSDDWFLPQLPVSLHWEMGFLEFFRSKWQCIFRFYMFRASWMILVQITYGVICSPFADHFTNSLNVYSQDVVISNAILTLFGDLFQKYSSTMNTRYTTHLENLLFWKMFITIVMCKINEVSFIRNETWNIFFPVVFVSRFYGEYQSSYKRLLSITFFLCHIVHISKDMSVCMFVCMKSCYLCLSRSKVFITWWK